MSAGSLRQRQQPLQQQQQISNVASSLAAAVQSPQLPTVHIERVELSANLRVAGDDASDSIRRKRAKRNEFEQWQRVKGMGMVNLVEGGVSVSFDAAPLLFPAARLQVNAMHCYVGKAHLVPCL